MGFGVRIWGLNMHYATPIILALGRLRQENGVFGAVKQDSVSKNKKYSRSI
jgi:hypothetical protein